MTSIPLVVFYNAIAEGVPALGDHVVLDERAEIYEALGTKRMAPVRLMARSIGPGLKSARQGILPRATPNDMLRLGADAAVDADGEIVLLHVASSPDDRVDPAELLRAVGCD